MTARVIYRLCSVVRWEVRREREDDLGATVGLCGEHKMLAEALAAARAMAGLEPGSVVEEPIVAASGGMGGSSFVEATGGVGQRAGIGGVPQKYAEEDGA